MVTLPLVHMYKTASRHGLFHRGLQDGKDTSHRLPSQTGGLLFAPAALSFIVGHELVTIIRGTVP